MDPWHPKETVKKSTAKKTEQKGPEKTTTQVTAKERVKKEREDLEHKVHVGPAAARTSSGSAPKREAAKDR